MKERKSIIPMVVIVYWLVGSILFVYGSVFRKLVFLVSGGILILIPSVIKLVRDNNDG